MSSYWNYRECYDNETVMGGTPDDYDDDQDSSVCPYCGNVIFKFDGEFVCDECGPISDDEVEDE